MSKTLDTKIKILKILNKKPRTVTQVSEILGLAQSTVSQHIDELKESGAIEEFDDRANRKWKYYKVNKNYYDNLINKEKSTQKEYLLIKKVVAVLIVFGILAIIFIAYQVPKSTISKNVIINATITTSIVAKNMSNNYTIIPVDTAMACPIIFANQTFNTTIINYSGIVYYNNNITQFVLPRGGSETLYLNVSKPQSSNSVIIHNFAEFIYSQSYNATNNASTVINVSRQINVVINNTNGVTIRFNRTFEQLNNSIQYMHLKVTINTTANATQGTYRVVLPEGPCKPHEIYMLLTIGKKPYNNTITPVAIPYG